MGECFNGFSGYVGDYQNHLTALFNYPMYYSIRDAFAYGKSMTVLRDRWNEEQRYFRDIDALGIFVDNHDNPRFLNGNGEHKVFKSALAFSLTARGIPFFYYGSEQGFAGGQDPYNREALWNNLDETSEIYSFVSTIMRARKSH
jgi:alpha-amylase